MTAAVAAGRAVAATAPAHERVAARREALVIGLAEAALHDGLWWIALPAPLVAPAAMLTAPPAHDVAVSWEPRVRAGEAGEEWAIAGAGAAAELRASGPGRVAAIAAAARALWARAGGATVAGSGAVRARVAVGELAALGVPNPRLIGGLSFAPGAWTAAWAPFGDAWFALPRWTYARRGDAAWLILAVDGPREAGADWQAELDAIDAALARPLPAPTAGRVLEMLEPDAAAWRREIDGIRAAIDAGVIDKVVAARPSSVELADAIDPAVVVAQLGERHPDCTRFAMRAAATTFVGASPERLMRQRGRAVESEALAGSIARSSEVGDAEAAARLFASDKDRGEHEWVVRAIADTLGPRCEDLTVPAEPLVRTLRQILHLHTPVKGHLAAPGHVLDLVAALHPTPAVGGTPTADALAWIAEHEPPRGWYASPVGWFDAAGDGDFAVAIRSGLLAGRRAEVWAGAGIVRESDADAELAEVRLKRRALLGALGVL